MDIGVDMLLLEIANPREEELRDRFRQDIMCLLTRVQMDNGMLS